MSADAKHWTRHKSRLASLLAKKPFGLTTDIDGTLSQIVSVEPAAVSPSLKAAIAELTARCAVVALISGRPTAAIRQMIDVPGVEIFGLHGFQRVQNGRPMLAPGVEQWKQPLEQATLELAAVVERFGVTLESKEVSVVINWRLSATPDIVPEVVAAVRAVAEAHGLAVMPARRSLEVHPPMKVNKGTCMTVLAHEYKLQGIIYLGDDHSDIASFVAIRGMRADGLLDGLALGVQSSEMPAGLVAAADLVLDDVADVEQFFSWLCEHV